MSASRPKSPDELPESVLRHQYGTMEQGYWLGFSRSRKDLEALGDELREGITVTIYMPDELEMTATLTFDPIEKVWWANAVDGTITYLDGSV